MHKVTFLLLIVGGINWLLLGVFNWEISAIFGGPSAFPSKVIYILVGLSALYELSIHKKSCKACIVSPSGKDAAPQS